MTVRINGQDFDVKLTSEAIGGEEGGQNIIGRSNTALNLIAIDGTLPDTRQEEVLLHEILHLVAADLPEFMVRDIGNNLYGALADNNMLAGGFISQVLDGRATADEMRQLNEVDEEIEEMAMPMRETETSHKVSEGPWGSARFTQEQWAASCLLHTHAGVGKARLALPVREPNGALNRAACHDAAAFLAGARGGILDGPEGIRVDLLRGTAQEQRNAARTLVRIYRRDLGETPPESLLKLAG